MDRGTDRQRDGHSARGTYTNKQTDRQKDRHMSRDYKNKRSNIKLFANRKHKQVTIHITQYTYFIIQQV